MRLAAAIALLFCSAVTLPADEPAQQDVIEISRETTFVTDPLTADGFPNYKEFLNRKMSEGVTNETNAAIWYWKAMGNPEDAVEHRKLMEAYWGVTLFDENAQHAVNISQFAQQKGIEGPAYDALIEQQGNSGDAPWTS